jgi:hypothetical protein
MKWRVGAWARVSLEGSPAVAVHCETGFPDVAVSPAFLPRLTSFESTKRALQGGFDNITNHANPRVVNSEINSPQFRTFGAVQGRDFTSRIRLRERK